MFENNLADLTKVLKLPVAKESASYLLLKKNRNNFVHKKYKFLWKF